MWSSFYFSLWMSISQAPICWKHSPISIELLLHLCQTSIGHFYVDHFLGSPFCFIGLCTWLSTNPTLSWLLSLYSKPRYQFAFSNCFSYSRSLPFQMHFRISLCVYKTPCWEFHRNCIEPISQFGENWPLYYVDSYNLRLWYLSPFS